MSFIEGIQAVSSGTGPASGLASGLVPTGGGLAGAGSMTINALAGADPVIAPAVDASTNGFGGILSRSIESLDNVQSTADNLAVQAATGDLKDVHDYTLAASRAQLMTELVVAVRNKGIDAFTEIMRMPL
jgi:flagellar hook-basal body complex protein FliE